MLETQIKKFLNHSGVFIYDGHSDEQTENFKIMIMKNEKRTIE